MPQNIKITPASGLLELIGNTLNIPATQFKLTVDATGNVTLTTSPAVKAYITSLGIDPTVLLGTTNQIDATYGGVNGKVTMKLSNTVVFPGTAQITATPTGPNDIANKAYVDANASKRLATRAVSTADIALSTAPATIDGVSLVNGDRVLVAGQTSQPNNGIYVFNGVGAAMTRATDFDSWDEVVGALITVSLGSIYGNTLWMSTSPLTGTFGSTNITFKRVDDASAVPGNAGVVHTDGVIFTASLITDADVNDVAWNKITGVPGTIGNPTLQIVTANANTTDRNIVLLETGIPSAPASGAALYANTAGAFGWVNTSGFAKSFDGTITANRTYTLPDISGALVLTTATQTLDNKTLTNVAIQIGSDAQGDIYYRAATGKLTRLALGTTGQVLAAGAGIPAWGNPTVDWSDITGTPTTLAGYGITDPILLTTGGTMTGDLILNTNPTVPFQAATKQYVDNLALGLDWKNSAKASTAGTPLPPNIADGTFQTLIANSNGAFPTIDGQTIALNDIVLVMDEATPANNGSYVLTQVGSGSLPWILTRTSDSNTGASLVSATYYIQSGTLFGNRVYTVSTPAPITLGTSAINFVQIAGANAYGAGPGITLNGNIFSISAAAVTNAMLQNSSIALALTSLGTTPTWSTSSVALGGTATLNLPTASATNTGVLSAADWVTFNSKLSAANAFVQSGNAFGATAVLGTTDTNDVAFITNSVEIARLRQVSGAFLLGLTIENDAARLQVSGGASIFSTVNTVPQLKMQKAATQTFATPTIVVNDSSGAQIAGFLFTNTNQLITGSALINGATVSGTNNTSLGFNTFNNISSGFNNTAVGYASQLLVTIGSNNTSLGSRALNALVNGTNNTVIGSFAGSTLFSGSDNVFVGYQAGNNATTGGRNVFIGGGAGYTNIGSDNVLIGYNAGYNTGNVNQRLYISNNAAINLIYGEFDNQLLRLNSTVDIVAPSLNPSNATSALAISQTWATTGSPVLINANVSSSSYGAGSLLMALKVNNVIQFSVDPVGNVTIANGLNIGNLRLPTSTTTLGTIYKNNQLFISSYAGGGTQDINIFVGYQSGNLTNTGAGLNSALGYKTLSALTNGAENTAVGANSLTALSTGNNNVAIGSGALRLLVSGSGNVVVGTGAMSQAMTAGNNNTVLGHQAGLTSTGTGNVFIGFNAGQAELGSGLLYIANSATTTPLLWGNFTQAIARVNGQFQNVGLTDVDNVVIRVPITKSALSTFVKIVDSANAEILRINGNSTSVFIGNVAGGTVFGGTHNTGLGNQALKVVANGASNTAIGSGTLALLTDGASNTMVGALAGTAITTGNNNIGLGSSALIALTTGSANVAIGNNALGSNLTGINNVGIGLNAGTGNTGSNNIFIGVNAGADASFNGLSNQLAIGASATPLIGGDFNLKTVTLNASLNLTVPAYTSSSAANVNAINLTQTWDYVGQTASLIKAFVTDANSAANSMLLTLNVNATDMFTVNKAGNTFIAGSITAPALVTPVNAYQFVVWDTTTKAFGVVSGGGGGGSITAENGLSSPAADTVQLGQSSNTQTGDAILLGNTFIPLGGYWLQLNTTNASEYIRFAANHFDMQNSSLSHITLDMTGNAFMSITDGIGNAPAIYLSTNTGVSDITIQAQVGLFQIVENTQTSGFVYDTTNFRFGIKTLTPTHDFEVAGTTGIVHSLTGSAADSALEIVETWNTSGVPTALLMNVTKTAVGVGAKLIDVRQDGISRLAVNVDAGMAIFQTGGLQLQTSGSGPGGISLNGSPAIGNSITVSQGFIFGQSNGLGATPTSVFTFDPGTVIQTTSGTLNFIRLLPSGAFEPTSGGAVLNAVNLQFTINQTGTANGITRGLYINPTLTSAIDFRALEITAGKVILPNVTLGLQVLSGTQTLSVNATHYIFNDTVTQTWTLPNNASAGNTIFVKNRSSVELTIAGPVGQTIYDQSSVTTLDIQPGDAYIFVFDGTYWNAE